MDVVVAIVLWNHLERVLNTTKPQICKDFSCVDAAISEFFWELVEIDKSFISGIIIYLEELIGTHRHLLKLNGRKMRVASCLFARSTFADLAQALVTDNEVNAVLCMGIHSLHGHFAYISVQSFYVMGNLAFRSLVVQLLLCGGAVLLGAIGFLALRRSRGAGK